jgi:hypothetical protein
MWIRLFVGLLRRGGAIDPQTDARFDAYLARERAGLIEDFQKQPPDIILVDSSGDWGAWALADPDLSVLSKPYRWHRASTASTSCAEPAEAMHAADSALRFRTASNPAPQCRLIF